MKASQSHRLYRRCHVQLIFIPARCSIYEFGTIDVDIPVYRHQYSSAILVPPSTALGLTSRQMTVHTLLWITKTPTSRSLSHSEGQEQLDILSQAQRVSRRRKTQKISTRKRVARKPQSSTSGSYNPVKPERLGLHGTCHISNHLSPLTPSWLRTCQLRFMQR